MSPVVVVMAIVAYMDMEIDCEILLATNQVG